MQTPDERVHVFLARAQMVSLPAEWVAFMYVGFFCRIDLVCVKSIRTLIKKIKLAGSEPTLSSFVRTIQLSVLPASVAPVGFLTAF